MMLGRRTGSLLVASMLLAAVGSSPAAFANHPEGSCVDLEPESDSNETDTRHTMTATLRTQSGDSCGGVTRDPDAGGGAVTIAADITGANDPDSGGPAGEPDLTCNVTTNQTSCELSYQGENAGTDTITSWIDHDKDGARDSDESSDSVEKTWTEPTTGPAVQLDCSPESANNRPNTSHTVTCTASDADERAVSEASLDAEAIGTNDPDGADSPSSPDFSCITEANGKCSFTHTGSSTGTTTYLIWIDSDNNDSSVEADRQEGQNEKQTPGADAEPDDTDTVEKTWSEDAPPPEEERECPGFEGDRRNDVIGTSGPDRLVGSPRDDIICAFGGADEIVGRGGHDLILAGGGADSAYGGGGKDRIRGGGGTDTLRGGAGDDRLFGGRRGDRLFGGRGNDLLDGGPGRDLCRGGPGRDRRRRC